MVDVNWLIVRIWMVWSQKHIIHTAHKYSDFISLSLTALKEWPSSFIKTDFCAKHSIHVWHSPGSSYQMELINVTDNKP